MLPKSHKSLKTPYPFFLLMQINVFFDRENKEKTIELDVNSSVKDLLSKMNINPVTVIVSKDNNIIMENEKIN